MFRARNTCPAKIPAADRSCFAATLLDARSARLTGVRQRTARHGARAPSGRDGRIGAGWRETGRERTGGRFAAHRRKLTKRRQWVARQMFRARNIRAAEAPGRGRGCFAAMPGGSRRPRARDIKGLAGKRLVRETVRGRAGQGGRYLHGAGERNGQPRARSAAGPTARRSREHAGAGRFAAHRAHSAAAPRASSSRRQTP